MRALGDDALIDSATQAARATLRFAAGVGIRDRVDAIVAAEADCCSFLNMAVSEGPDEVVLTIHAPEEAELVLAELVGAFRGEGRVAE